MNFEYIVLAFLLSFIIYLSIYFHVREEKLVKRFEAEKTKLIDRIMAVDYVKYHKTKLEKESINASLQIQLERIKKNNKVVAPTADDIIQAAQQEGRITEA